MPFSYADSSRLAVMDRPPLVVTAPIVLMITARLVSGRARQFIDTKLNMRCSIWGEMRACMGARRRARAEALAESFAPVPLRGGDELHGVAEFLQLADQTQGLVLLVVPGGEVVRAEVGEDLPGGEHVPDHVEEAVGHRDRGLVRAPAPGYLPVLGAEVAVPGPRRRPGRLDHGPPQPLVALRGSHPAALAGRLVIAGTQARPRGQVRRAGEAAHGGAGRGDDDLHAPALQPGNLSQQPGRLLVAPGDPRADLTVEFRDRVVQEVQMRQDAGRDYSVMRAEVAAQGLGQLRDLRPQPPPHRKKV